jgi:hypothetical protein
MGLLILVIDSIVLSGSSHQDEQLPHDRVCWAPSLQERMTVEMAFPREYVNEHDLFELPAN